MGTMTEPDCLGPLDPGTSVTLEGIVWHETDGGEILGGNFGRAASSQPVFFVFGPIAAVLGAF